MFIVFHLLLLSCTRAPGLHWANNAAAPYTVGDTTTSGEALALLVPPLVGAKPLLTCAANATSASLNLTTCLLVSDPPVASTGRGGRVHLLIVHEGPGVGPSQLASSAEATAAAASGAPASLSIDVAPLALPPTSFIIISQVSAGSPGFYGEVSLLAPLPAASAGGARVILHTLPPFGVMRLTAPTSPIAWTNASCGADATLTAGSSVATPLGATSTLVVGTSTTSVHDTTSMALIRFAVQPSAISASVAVLELSVAVPPASATTVLTVVGYATADSDAWDEASVTWGGATSAFAVSNAGATGVPPPRSAPCNQACIVGRFTCAAGCCACGGSPSLVLNNTNANLANLVSATSIVGHISVGPGDAAGTLKRLDVTSFVAAAASAGHAATFLLTRRCAVVAPLASAKVTS